ncbi:myocardin isoform X3 [Onychostruthus taczanowskii]|uniref:myocardin isoform X3 n=1 Tax=Onychostruthus taczanowskii TaxID=356909 RepID=UPI001B80B168|nr:myocardin isoform X3 [Onychostruthus taczanowskii]XP_041283300.1 myocardin isoform X3 [Onychostruthus taczanowskii]
MCKSGLTWDPALKSPSAFHEQRKSLERAKTEDYLKHKIRSRPERSDLVNMHILQDSAAEGSIQSTQMKLKRARLADDLNEKIALRPGPLELVEKNIIPVDSAVKEAIKGTQGGFPRQSDAFAFEEDSSNDGLSPERPRSRGSPGPAEPPPGSKAPEPPPAGPAGAPQDRPPSADGHAPDTAPGQGSQCDSPKQPAGQESPTLPVPSAVKSKSASDSKNRHKKPKDTKPKVKKLKYHQYIPPDQKAEKSPPPMDSAYARLLQQQQLFLQLQILSQQQQQQQQQHFSYPGMHQGQLKQSNEQMVKSSNPSSTSGNNTPLSPVKTTFSGQTCVSSIKPGPLPSNLDDLKVSELRQQLRIRGLPVSGTKTALMERLRPFQECSSSTVPSFSEITTVTFPVTPTSTLSSYQSQSSTSLLSNGFYHFGSTSSTPPISPASSDLSVSGSLPDTFNDGPMASPQFALQPSPVHGSAEESLMSSMNGGSIQLELEGIDTEKDKMLVEKQKVINELTWKLQQEQRQVEELRMQLQKRKRSNGLEEKQQPAQHFFGVPIKQENTVSSCPFASKQMALKGQAGSSDKLSNCGVPQVPHIVNSHCLEPAGQSTITSSTFLSPQCSPQHSPLGAAKSPQHISLPPSPNSHYLLPVSPEGRSGSPPGSSCLRTAPMAAQSGQKFSISSPSFCKSSPALSEVKQPPPYEDAVKQQMTRSQQMDELLDVLIESGEIPANAKEDRSCLQKVPQIMVSPGSSGGPVPKGSAPFEPVSSAPLPFEHCPGSSDAHLEVLLNAHSPLGRVSEMALLKLGGEEPHFEGMMEGFSGKAADELLNSQEILQTPLSPMDTQLSPSPAESSALQMSFTESPWETMEWLDLTPPSSATGFSSLTPAGPSIFNIDFLDVADLNLNTSMDLHLQQW